MFEDDVMVSLCVCVCVRGKKTGQKTWGETSSEVNMIKITLGLFLGNPFCESVPADCSTSCCPLFFNSYKITENNTQQEKKYTTTQQKPAYSASEISTKFKQAFCFWKS